MKKSGLVSLWGIIIVTLAVFVGTFVAGNEPLLGLDLQGGVSVVLQPVEEADDEQLDQSIEIIRRRIDSIGVAEPEITRQGDTILVQIPGVEDQERALELVGQTAELRFRPVLGVVPEGTDLSDATTTTAPGTTGTTVPGSGGTTVPGGATTVPSDGTTIAPTETTVAPSGDETGAGGFSEGEHAGGFEAAQPTIPPAPDATAPSTDPTLDPSTLDPATLDPATLGTGLDPSALEVTPPEQDEADQPVTLPGRDEIDGARLLYQLGPAALTGEALEGATASLTPGTGQWTVLPTFKGGENGIDLFNAVAAECFAKGPTCPTGQLAITLDGEVISAPAIQQASFERDGISISGEFTEGEAKDLALVLRYGALPVELEPQQTQIVSATLGEDALRAGIIAGIVGLIAVTLYLVLFYRLLGLIAVASLAISSMLLWAVISYLGETQGLALTLAGVTGIIVSIGVSVDSNVVYYEHIKEGVREGRTLRSSAERTFSSAFSTIVKADVASLIGAVILYFLTVGPVRGFAFYLGLATLLDLVAAWFFMRPCVIWLARTKPVEHHPGLFGIRADEVASPVSSPPSPPPVTAGVGG
jgi:preprotein translocase subunit SecD